MTEYLNYEPIYEAHHERDTCRFGVAYLRAEEVDQSAEEYEDPYPDLEEQRRIISGLARAAETLIIAEFIDDCGPIEAESRPALSDLLNFWHETHPSVMFAANERVLAFDTHDSFFFRAALNADRPESLITSGD
ncbi:MAG: hypothetical protein ACTH30_10235 [Leucobacter sp.]